MYTILIEARYLSVSISIDAETSLVLKGNTAEVNCDFRHGALGCGRTCRRLSHNYVECYR